MLLEVGAGQAVGVQGAVEVRHHGGLQVEGAAHLPELDALDRGGHAPEDAHLVAVQGVAPALEVGHPQAKGLHQVVVQQAAGRYWQVGRHQHSEGAAFTREYKLVIIITVLVICCEEIVAVCCCCFAHRWSVEIIF